MQHSEGTTAASGIAIVGLAARFPGAKNAAQYWENLKNGVESITFFKDEELDRHVVVEKTLQDPNYVKAGAVLEGADELDAAFFDFTPREAETTDPQHRLFLECVWGALENAGCDPARYEGRIGAYGGSTFSGYWNHLNADVMDAAAYFQSVIGTQPDFLTTLASYKLNLHGPSVAVQTACSTSLVAVHQACQSLLVYECDLALAGGVSVRAAQNTGYVYQEGGILSPDGHCRAFDRNAKGTVPGNGAGVVALKRLEDALADGDHIYAVIKGSAINNDGMEKVGFTAPSVDRQSQVIAEALAVANMDPATITYVEAHGTGTALGDPIEVSALTRAYRVYTENKQYCAIGSVKTNIGHLDAAAGVAGLIKAVLSLHHKQLPPHLHYEAPNEQIDFANSPFYVNMELNEWKTDGTPRRAGVSSFGIGGTNAHVVLEEAPVRHSTPSDKREHLLLLSARTNTALDAMADQLADFIEQHPEAALADVAYTLQTGRKEMAHRRAVRCHSRDEAVRLLRMKQTMLDGQEPHLQTVGERWVQGEQADVTELYAGEARQRLPLPGYPFERKPYFMEYKKAASAGRLELADSFYIPAWKQAVPATAASGEPTVWLLFEDGHGIGAEVKKRLLVRGEVVCTVIAGDGFAQVSEYAYVIDPARADHYRQLIKALEDRELYPRKMLHFWSLETEAPSYEQLQQRGIFSLMHAAQAVGQTGRADAVELTAVTNNLQAVAGEEILLPERATLYGLLRVMPQELKNITCRTLDVDAAAWSGKRAGMQAQQIVGELLADTGEFAVAYRGGHRFVKTFEPVRLPVAANGAALLREEGVYLITGATTDIGRMLAERLTESLRAKIILVADASLPLGSEWQARRVERVQQLIGQEADIHYAVADLTDAESIRSAIAEGEARYGAIAGVIHADAPLHHVGLIQLDTAQTADARIAPRVRAALALADALEERQIDFLLFFSSLQSMIGEAGQMNRSSADSFLESFVPYLNGLDVPAALVHWSLWQADEWFESHAQIPADILAHLQRIKASYGITAEEGAEAVARIIAGGVRQVAVSMQDLLTAARVMMMPASAPGAQPSASGAPDENYVGPRNQTEQIVAEIWQELLGFEKVSVDQNFFELGGNSLMGIQLVNRLRNLFSTEVPMDILFDAPTIADLSTALAVQEMGEDELEEIERMLAEIENLSPEELMAKLEGNS